MTSYGVDSAKLKEAKDKLPPIKLSSFVDPTQPWVLVPNGSLLGFFDWVSESDVHDEWRSNCDTHSYIQLSSYV